MLQNIPNSGKKNLYFNFYWLYLYSETERSYRDETDEGEKNQECEVLMTEARELMEVLYKGKGEK